MDGKIIDFKKAFETKDLGEFISLVFPNEWQPIVSRIMESGVEYGETEFAPKWSKIPFTVRNGSTDLETYVKSTIFRVHDVLHQLWGLPIPKNLDINSFYGFKRAWMCAEVAVLTLTEFVYCDWLYKTQCDEVVDIIKNRNAILMKNTTELKTKSIRQIAIRLDGLLHKVIRPLWVRENEFAQKFCDDFVPMLETDRVNIDWNWSILIGDNEFYNNIKKLPNQRYSNTMDGLELTAWMIDDFYHLLETDTEIDKPLMMFNRSRRNVDMPIGWNTPK